MSSLPLLPTLDLDQKSIIARLGETKLPPRLEEEQGCVAVRPRLHPYRHSSLWGGSVRGTLCRLGGGEGR